MQYPVLGGATDATGVINWKNFRTSQQPQCRWNTIETSAGVYSAAALANLDSIITHQRTQGASVQFCLYGTPVFYAQTAANPTYGDDVTVGPWAQYEASGVRGEGSYPNSLAAVTNFVTMIINRYNKPGGAWYDANFATLGKGIQSWEPATEPILPTGGNGNVTGIGGNGAINLFWWGTDTQLADYCATQYAAIKAADSSIQVGCPSLNPGSGVFDRDFKAFHEVVGPVLGQTVMEACDHIAWHPYIHGPVNMFYGEWCRSILSGPQGIITLRKWLDTNGYARKDLWINEWGVSATADTPNTRSWYAGYASYRYAWMARFLMTVAAFGVKTIMPWQWDAARTDYGTSGDWKTDADGVIAAYNDFGDKVSGKTIIGGTYAGPRGEVTVHMSDGSTWTV